MLAGAANGSAALPYVVAYDDDGPAEEPRFVHVADWFVESSPPELQDKHIGMAVIARMDRIGRRGFEERDAASLRDHVIPLDPTRSPKWLVLMPDQATWADDSTEVHVFAVTAMRTDEAASGR